MAGTTRVGNCRSRWLVVPAAGRQIRKRSDVMRLPASGRHYRAGNCRSRWLVVPAAGRQMRKRSDVMRLPASGRHYPCGELPKPVVGSAGRWPADTEAFRRRGVAGQRPALPGGELPKPVVGSAGRWPADMEAFRRHEVAGQRPALPCGDYPSRRLVVPAAGRQIRKRSDVMGVPASGRHYPCGELPKPVVGSAGRWPADTETFRRHGVAGQRPALPARGIAEAGGW